MSDYKLYNGDCLDELKKLPDNSIDSIVTDPPYGLSFMGKKWDYDVPSEDIWRECLRVLKPGGHLLAFAGTRTQHRMAVRIEDAGFEIRDMISYLYDTNEMARKLIASLNAEQIKLLDATFGRDGIIGWGYGSGFPKSHNISVAIDKAAGAEREVLGVAGKSGSVRNSMAGDFAGGEYMATAPTTEAAKQWAGWGTSLKPALEPITVARKPIIGTVAANVLEHGTGAMNIDGCRVEGRERTDYGLANSTRGAGNTYGKPSASADFDANKGRWPANLIHDGSDEVVGLFPVTTSGGGDKHGRKASTFCASTDWEAFKGTSNGGDSGSAARFFYCVPRESLYFPPKDCYSNDFIIQSEHYQWLDQNQNLSNAHIAELILSQQKEVECIVQKAVAIWPSLAGIVSNEWTEPFTLATPSELSEIEKTVIATIASIGSECLQEQRLEKRTQNNSLVSVAAIRKPTGIMTITISLSKSDGCAESVTFSITPSNLDRGEAVSRFKYCAKASKADRNEGLDNTEIFVLNDNTPLEVIEEITKIINTSDRTNEVLSDGDSNV